MFMLIQLYSKLSASKESYCVRETTEGFIILRSYNVYSKTLEQKTNAL